MLVCIIGSGCVNARRILSRAVLHHRPQESLLGETLSATPPCTCSLKFQLSIVLLCCLDDVVLMSQTKFVGKVRTAMAVSAHSGVLWTLCDKSVAPSVSDYQALCGHHWLSVHVQRGKPTLVNMFEGSTHLSWAESLLRSMNSKTSTNRGAFSTPNPGIYRVRGTVEWGEPPSLYPS